MTLLRKILSAIFFFIYVIVCPVIILDALGLRLRPDQNKILQSTGLISLATIPPGASVLIDHRPLEEKTPTIVRNLSQGDHKVTIIREGYLPWEKSVSVIKEEAVALEDIILIPKAWPQSVVSPFPIDEVVTVNDNPFILLKRGPLAQDLWVFKYRDSVFSHLKDGLGSQDANALQPLLSPASPFGPLKVVALQIMPESPFLWIQAVENDRTYYLWGDLRSLPSPLQDISRHFDAEPRRVFWHADDSENIFWLSDNTLNRINIKENVSYPGLAAGVLGAAAINKKMLVVTQDRRFNEVDYSDKTQKSLLGQWPTLPDIFSRSLEMSLHVLTPRSILFLDLNGALFSNRLPYQLFLSGIAGIGDVLNRQKVLVWTKNQLGVIDLAKTRDEGIFEAGPQITWLVKNARGIRQAFWVNKGSHVLFVDLDQVRLVEIDPSGQNIFFDVMDIKGLMAYSEYSGKVYAVGKKSGQLQALTVVSEHPLPPQGSRVPLPEGRRQP